MKNYKLPSVPSRTTPGFAFSYIDRALRECLGARQFGQKEIGVVLDFFDSNPPECVYCGSQDIKRWDHLVPIKNGGETILGNMVPACSACDDSKQDLPFDDWIWNDSPSSPKSRGVTDINKRITRIRSYVQRFDYQVIPLEERLDPDELEKLAEIRETTVELRKDIDQLIESYRNKRYLR